MIHPITTPQEFEPAPIDTGQIARNILTALPKGAKYYASTWKLESRHAEEKRRDVVKELREASRDLSIAAITVVILFDEVTP